MDAEGLTRQEKLAIWKEQKAKKAAAAAAAAVRTHLRSLQWPVARAPPAPLSCALVLARRAGGRCSA